MAAGCRFDVLYAMGISVQTTITPSHVALALGPALHQRLRAMLGRNRRVSRGPACQLDVMHCNRLELCI